MSISLPYPLLLCIPNAEIPEIDFNRKTDWYFVFGLGVIEKAKRQEEMNLRAEQFFL